MIVVRTLEEAKNATNGFIVVYFPFQKKHSASELHPGHAALLHTGKQYGNKTMIGFMYSQVMLNYLDSMWMPESTLDWDRDGCLSWAEMNNVDIVWAPDYDAEIGFCNLPNMAQHRILIDEIWKNEGYEKHFVNKISSEKAKLICLVRWLNNTNWKYVFSWKDGITRYIEADFMHKYTNKRVVIVGPVKAPDGLYYSSSYFKYTDAEKSELINIEAVVNSSDLSVSNPEETLVSNIKATITDPSFVLQGVSITKDERFLGKNKKIIDVKFSIGTDDVKYDHYSFLL